MGKRDFAACEFISNAILLYIGGLLMSRNHGLLAYLEPALRPTGVEGGGPGVRAGVKVEGGERGVSSGGRWSFDELIMLAKEGRLATGRKVTAAPGVHISIDDLARIGAAADRVEAKGGKRAIIFSGKDLLLLDIATRRISERLVGVSENDNEKDVSVLRSDERIVTGIDSAVIFRDGEVGVEEVDEEEAGRILAGLERPLRGVGS